MSSVLVAPGVSLEHPGQSLDEATRRAVKASRAKDEGATCDNFCGPQSRSAWLVLFECCRGLKGAVPFPSSPVQGREAFTWPGSSDWLESETR